MNSRRKHSCRIRCSHTVDQTQDTRQKGLICQESKEDKIDGIIGYESHETFKKGKVGTRLSQEVYALKQATKQRSISIGAVNAHEKVLCTKAGEQKLAGSV